MNALTPLSTVIEKVPYRGPNGGTTANPPRRMNYAYERIIDLMLSEPHLTQNEIAKQLDYSVTWLSIVVNSDVFKTHYEMRRAAFNLALQERISGKLSEATEAALDSLIDGINEKGANLSVMDRKEVADTLLQRLGYGTKSAPAVSVSVNTQTNVAAVSPDILAEARKSYRAVEELRLARARGDVVDVASSPGEPATTSPKVLDFNVE